MPRLWLSTILITAQFAATRPLLGQGNQSRLPSALAWVTAGIGGGGAGGAGFAAAASADVLARHHLFSLRATGVAVEFGNDFWDAGLLYGRVHRTKWGLLAASVGLAVVDGERCGGGLGASCTQVPASVGLPLSASASWHVSSNLGVGLSAFGDVNHEQSFGGLVLNIQLGRLR